MTKVELKEHLDTLPDDAEVEFRITREQLAAKMQSIILRWAPIDGYDWYKIEGIRGR